MINTRDAAFGFKVGQVASLALWQQGILQTLSTFRRQGSCLPQPIGWAQVQDHAPYPLKAAGLECNHRDLHTTLLPCKSGQELTPLQAASESELGVWYSSSSHHTTSRGVALLEQGYALGQNEQWGVCGESHQGTREMPRGIWFCSFTEAWSAVTRADDSWSCLMPVLCPLRFSLHSITSLGTHSGGNFRYGQSLLLPAYINRKGHWPDIIQDKGLGRREKRGKEKKILFVGSV